MGLQWVGTNEMSADGFTKTLPGPALSNFRDKLHLKVTLWGSIVTYASCMHIYACVATCADAIADAWRRTAVCTQAFF